MARFRRPAAGKPPPPGKPSGAEKSIFVGETEREAARVLLRR